MIKAKRHYTILGEIKQKINKTKRGEKKHAEIIVERGCTEHDKMGIVIPFFFFRRFTTNNNSTHTSPYDNKEQRQREMKKKKYIKNSTRVVWFDKKVDLCTRQRGKKVYLNIKNV